MNKTFYKRCKKVVAELELSYEQGIARDVILNELDTLEKQVADYQKRFSKAIEYINNFNVFEKFSFPLMKKWEENQVKGSIDYELNDTLKKELLNILEGE